MSGNCIDCGKSCDIRSKRCRSCARKGPRNPAYVGGHQCTVCNKKVTNNRIKYCIACWKLIRNYAGELNPNYKNGNYIGNTPQQTWATKIKELHNNRCALCDSFENLEAHHILPQSDYPVLRFNLDNGIPLCSRCHKSIRGKEYEYVLGFDQAVLKLRELDEPWDGNIEPSLEGNFFEGVETRGAPKSKDMAIKTSTSAGHCQ